MKKSKIKRVIDQAMKPYYDGGFTNTAARVYKLIMDGLDKLYKPKR